MDEKIEISDREKRILTSLNDGTDSWGEMCYSFGWIEGLEGLSKYKAGKVMKRLRDLELVEYHRGLMTGDGEFAGSGYCITEKGSELINSIDGNHD